MNSFRFGLIGEAGQYSLLRCFERAIAKLGHDSSVFPANEKLSQLLWKPLRNRAFHRLTVNSFGVRKLMSQRYNDEITLYGQDNKFDIFIIFNGHFVFPETIQSLKGTGAKVVIYHADNPLPGPASYNHRPETIPCSLEADLVCIWSKAISNELKDLNINSSYIPFAWDGATFPATLIKPKQNTDIVFIGGWSVERESFLEEIAKYHRVSIWGPSYWRTRTKKFSRLKPLINSGAVEGRKAASLLSGAFLALNIPRAQHMHNGHHTGTIMRNYEVPGCGGALLGFFSPEAQEAQNGIADTLYTTVDDCLDLLEQFKTNPNTLSKVASEVSLHIRAKHTYDIRIAQILKHL